VKNWEKHFGIIGCSKFVMPGIGEIDATRENLSEDLLLKAYNQGCKYIVLTPAGLKKYFPQKKTIEVNEIEHFNPIVMKKFKKSERPC
jgi:hypothetical protein